MLANGSCIKMFTSISDIVNFINFIILIINYISCDNRGTTLYEFVSDL